MAGAAPPARPPRADPHVTAASPRQTGLLCRHAERPRAALRYRFCASTSFDRLPAERPACRPAFARHPAGLARSRLSRRRILRSLMIAPKRGCPPRPWLANCAGVIGARLAAERGDAIAQRRRAEDAVDLAVQPVDHIGRRAGGRVEAEHRVGIEALQPGLVERRHVGEQRRALAGCPPPAASACRPARAAGAMPGSNRKSIWPASRSVSAGAAPRYGTCTREHAGLRFHHLAGQVRRAAVARRAEAELAGVGLQVGEELLRRCSPGTSGLTTRNTSTRAAAATGVRSLIGSNVIFE